MWATNLAKIAYKLKKEATNAEKSLIFKEKIANLIATESEDPKTFYRKVLAKTIPPPMWMKDKEGNCHIDSVSKLKVHTDFWKSISNKTVEQKPLTKWSTNKVYPYCTDITYPITLKEYKQAIGKSNKATGSEGIPMEVIANSPNNVINQYVNILNNILINKHIPDALNLAKTVLLPKNPNATYLPEKYRPITLLNTQ